MTWVLATQVAEYSYEIVQTVYPTREAAIADLVEIVAENEDQSIGGPYSDYPGEVTRDNVEGIASYHGVEFSLIEVGT
jgi:hypothetical protein